ncbi:MULTISPECIES: hypothetical protein [unclassified Endozoicomonas]|uniref:hypothetical protein n=1 Tax=unclassified Endozoicomonas TaxID=2644528 RepID=UPI00214908C2|nr:MULTISPECIES: hypothetical protein [unclassified Endozoicomonas]
MLILVSSVVCQAELLIVEFKENAVFPGQSLSIKCGLHRLPGSQIAFADINIHARSDSPPEDRPDTSGRYGVMTPLIEPISWQLHYASHLLVGYELLILTTKNALPGAAPCSWLPLEAFVAIGRLLGSYWDTDSPLLNPIEQHTEQKEVSQDNPFVITTMMFGSGQPLQQGQTSGPFVQENTAAASFTGSSFNHPLYSDSGGGNAGPQHHSHTLGLNCFIHPCHGVCQFRPSSNNGGPDEWLQNSEENFPDHKVASLEQSSCPHLANGRCFSCISHFDPENSGYSYQQDELFEAFDYFAPIQLQYINDTPVHSMITGSVLINDAPFGRQACDVPVTGEDGPQKTCGKDHKNARSLPTHKRKINKSKKTCDVIVIGEDGQPRPCGKACIHYLALSYHKRRDHSGQQICDVIVIAENGQQRPCEKVCKNAKALTDHKSKYHTGQKVCDVIVGTEDGRHRPCWLIFDNAKKLSDHKRKCHTGQKTCWVSVVTEDGHQRPCGKLCNNARDLLVHKRRHHCVQKACELTMVGEDGDRGPCGKLCKNDHALSEHIRTHGKRKRLDVNQNDDLNPLAEPTFLER